MSHRRKVINAIVFAVATVAVAEVFFNLYVVKDIDLMGRVILNIAINVFVIGGILWSVRNHWR
jgi:hypothetical protein